MIAARRGLVVFLAAASLLSVPFAPKAAARIVPSSDPSVFVILVPGVSFEDLLAVPEVRALARAGGAALMSPQGGLPTRPEGLPAPSDQVSWTWLAPDVPGGLARVGAQIRQEVLRSTRDEVLVLVASPVSSAAMMKDKDVLHPMVMAEGAPALLFPARGALRTLSSDTTRRTGVVTDQDVRPTVLDFLGRAIPTSLAGSPLRVVGEPPPFDLHERYLAMLRMRVPVQGAAGIYVTFGGLFGVALLALRRRVPRRLAHAGVWMAMSVPVLAVALLAAGHLPTLSYATVVPFAIVVTVVGTLAPAALARRDVLLPPAVIGAAVLVYFLVEAALGWTAALTPFLGGSELDGGRFYGLPNVFIGLLIGASLYVACRLRPTQGFLLVEAVALFAGLPFAGANLGAAVSLFAAGGLWLPLRARGRLGWRELALAAGVVVAGTAVVLLAHRFLTSAPTHITRFEEAAGRNPTGIWHTFTHRMAVGWHLVEQNPFALVPVVGLPATLVAVLRPPGPVREAFSRHPGWRDVLLVILLSGIVAVLANDSWPAAIGLVFGLALGGLIYVSLVEGTGKMGGT